MSQLWEKLQEKINATSENRVDSSTPHRVFILGKFVEITENQLAENMQSERAHLEKIRKKSLGLI